MGYTEHMTLTEVRPSEVFKTDGGATYTIEHRSDGTTTVTGHRSKVTYLSRDHVLVVTGKTVRNQGTMGGAFPFSVGRGVRARLVLDTGEGMEAVPGVLLR